MQKFTSTKLLRGYPCTHRQWKAESHCRFVHGYSRDFYFEFACKELTKEGWVVDFGSFRDIKAWLSHMFDHTFLASHDDPALSHFKQLDKEGIIQLRQLPNAGMEGTAQFVFDHVSKMIDEMTGGRAWVTKVEVRENEKNSAYLEDENPASERV